MIGIVGYLLRRYAKRAILAAAAALGLKEIIDVVTSPREVPPGAPSIDLVPRAADLERELVAADERAEDELADEPTRADVDRFADAEREIALHDRDEQRAEDLCAPVLRLIHERAED